MDKKYEGDIKKKLYKFFKRTLQIVLSVSAFSFFLWYSSGFSIYPQSFTAYMSTCLFSMLTRTLQRKYMFLICNFILALLAFKLEFHHASTHAKAQVSEEEVGAVRFSEINAPLVVEEEEYPEQVSEEEPGTDSLFIETEGREICEDSIAEKEASGRLLVAQDDEIVAETNEEVENTDELNRKFEEFIRKMKKEMRIEAQRQPIAV
ncbi:hypothetical protein Fmac_013717 [Flemingia macrophylla]|uniref:DUF4408 domain-containing protein n=1 Tax=Flemingia macrophylla TaxID=520843 RepID=A0ABD1MUE9_9FABA